MRISPRLANLLLLGASSLAALALAEASLRLLRPQPLDAAYVWPDGTLRHVPSFRYTYTRRDFSSVVSYNALGLRGRDVAPTPAPGSLRLAFLGDSFVEGKQVGDEDVLTARLERLAADRGRRLEVVNAGVGGYGTGDELLLWERAIAPLRPAVVLVGFFANDVRNNVDRALFELRDGRIVQVREPPLPSARWLYEVQKYLVARSHLAYLLKTVVLGAAGETSEQSPPGAPGELAEDEEVFAIDPSPRIARGWTLTLALLSELRLRVEAVGARFAVVAIPNRYQVDDAWWSAHVGRLGLEAAAFDRRTPQRRLGEWAADTGTELIDLLDALRRANGDNSFYYRVDAHWNAAGHDLAAETLLRELEARALVDGVPTGSAPARP